MIHSFICLYLKHGYKWEEQWATEKSNQGSGVNMAWQSDDNTKFQINYTKFNIYNYNNTMLENSD